MSKLKCPEFINLIRNYDIIGIQESKTDDTDVIEIPGYSIFPHNRARISRFKSGGITLIVKNEITPFIKVDKVRNSKFILLFTITQRLSHIREDIYCGIVYVPPYGSKYATDDPYLEIQSELLRYCVDSKYMLLFGDFNARTGNLPDFLKFDESICDENNLNDMFTESTELFNVLEKCSIPLERKSADNVTNVYGRNLLELCKNNNLFILNGRMGQDKLCPKVTCKDRSTVDYILSTVGNFFVLDNFTVHEFSELFSDAHCPLSVCFSIVPLKISHFITPSRNDGQEPMVRKWDATKGESFIEKFDVMEAASIETKLNELSHIGNITKSNINETVESIGKLFNTCSKRAFGGVTHTCSNQYNKIKPWFNGACFRARNLYHKCRKMYNKYKSNYYKNVLKLVSKKYKTTLSKTQRMYNDKKITDIRNLKCTNPK